MEALRLIIAGGCLFLAFMLRKEDDGLGLYVAVAGLFVLLA